MIEKFKVYETYSGKIISVPVELPEDLTGIGLGDLLRVRTSDIMVEFYSPWHDDNHPAVNQLLSAIELLADRYFCGDSHMAVSFREPGYILIMPCHGYGCAFKYEAGSDLPF